MPSIVYFISRSSGKKYRVLGVDKSTDPPTLTLQGETAVFTQAFDKELFKRCGYDLIREEVPEPSDPE